MASAVLVRLVVLGRILPGHRTGGIIDRDLVVLAVVVLVGLLMGFMARRAVRVMVVVVHRLGLRRGVSRGVVAQAQQVWVWTASISTRGVSVVVVRGLPVTVVTGR